MYFLSLRLTIFVTAWPSLLFNISSLNLEKLAFLLIFRQKRRVMVFPVGLFISFDIL